MRRTPRPGRSNGGSPALALFMVLMAAFLMLISLQITFLDRPARIDVHQHLRQPVERSA